MRVSLKRARTEAAISRAGSRRPAGRQFKRATGTIAAATLLFVVAAGHREHGLVSQTRSSRLTTVLADLAAEVPQESGTGAPAPSSLQPLNVDALAKPIRDAIRGGRLRLNDRNEAQVYLLVTEVTDDVVAGIAAAGGRLEIGDAIRRRVQARVPISRLQQVAALPFVRFVRLPNYAVRRRIGSVATEGDRILNADVARQQFGLDGTGIRVGVISDGLKGLFAQACRNCEGAAGGPIPLGDLPESNGVRALFTGRLIASTGGVTGQAFHEDGDLEGLPRPGCAFGGAGAEGTALLEIVHDLAPGARLAFANADTDLAFMLAVNALAADNDVVVDDLGFFGDAYDGTSGVSSNTAAALNNPANRIRAYVTSVGNSADQHYFGAYVNSGVDGTTIGRLSTPGRLHLFQPSAETTDVLGLGDRPFNVISLPEDGEAVIFLSWDDPSGASANDYDLFLVRESTNEVVARSTDRQTGDQDPLEIIDFRNDGASGLFHIVIQNVRDQAAPRGLNLFTLQPQCAPDGPRRLAPGRHERHNFNTATRSVSAQSDAGGSPVSVISVGAVCSASPAAASVFPASAPNDSCNDRTNRTIEFFSSRGPTLDGRMKPDIVAIDGVAVTGAGGFPNPFFGTSAAAPHVAAQAALLLQAAPCLVANPELARVADESRTRVRELILTSARPLSSVPNNVVGFGLANVFASIEQTLPRRLGPSAVIVPGNGASGAAIVASDLGISDPNQCAVTTLTATGGCSAGKGGTLACPFGTSTAAVSASNNGVAFSAPVNMQITVTDFGVSVPAGTVTIPRGQTSTRTVTIASVGGPFTRAVALACAGLPPGTTCSFSPPAVKPGAGFEESVLTIQTAAASGLPTERRGFSPGQISPGLQTPGSMGLMVVVVLMLVLIVRGPDVIVRGPDLQVRRHLALAGTLVLAFACDQMRQPSAPALTLSVTALDFGSQVTQTSSADRTVRMTNAGDLPLTIRSIVASGDFGQSHACGPTLAAGASCDVRVRFTPEANGARTGTLAITTNAASSPQTVALTGTGVPPAAGTPPGTYQISITGASGGLVHTAILTLVVQ
jgi:hypothetical protein